MKQFLLLIILLSFITLNTYSQYVKTDSMNLGEDRSSHNYSEYNPAGGESIKIGVYDCNGDQGINLGANSQYDSIVFYLAVNNNADNIRIQWNFSWYNAGTTEDQYPKVVIEDIFEDDLYASGPNAIGGNELNCDISLHKLEFTGIASYTKDGVIKVKIYDPYPTFAGNSCICKFEIYSNSSSSIESNSVFNNVKVFPNPFTNSIIIESLILSGKNTRVQLFDVLGNNHNVDIIKDNNKTTISTNELPNGIYFLKIMDKESGQLLSLQKLFKE